MTVTSGVSTDLSLLRDEYWPFWITDTLGSTIHELSGSNEVPADAVAPGAIDFIDNPFVAYLFLSAFELCERSKVIDVGAGLGGPARLFASTGAEVLAVDLLEEHVRVIDHFNRLLSVSNVKPIVGDAQALPLASERFTHYFSIGALCHTPDRPAAIDEAFRVLAPGGNLAIVDALQGPVPQASDRFERGFWHLVSPDDYATVLVDAGFVADEPQDLTAEYIEQLELFVDIYEGARATLERRFGGAEQFEHAHSIYTRGLDCFKSGFISYYWLQARKPDEE
jgi:SAM-dependent methyltransferase